MSKRNLIKRHPLIVFFVAAFALPWAVWFTSVAQAVGWIGWRVPGSLAFWLGLTIAAYGAAALTGGWPAVKDLLLRLVRVRVSPVWYAVALLVIPALTGLVVLIGWTLGQSVEVGVAVAPGGLVLLMLTNFVLFLFTEETAWRGFALPRLQARMSPLAAALVLGVIWGLWHIPLFLIPGSFQSGVPLVGFVIAAVATSVVASWIFNRTRGSVLVAALFHAATDLAIAFTGVMTSGGLLFWITVVCQCLLAAAVAPSLRALPVKRDGLVIDEERGLDRSGDDAEDNAETGDGGVATPAG